MKGLILGLILWFKSLTITGKTINEIYEEEMTDERN